MSVTTNSIRHLAAAGMCAVSALSLALLGCTSRSHLTAPEDKSATLAPPTNAVSQDHFPGGTYCVQTLLEGPAPAGPLHFSNQVTESDPTRKSKDFQADYAADTVDLTNRETWLATDEDRKFFEESKKFTDPKVITRAINNGVAEETVTNHATRSDGVAWRGVIVSISQGGTPWKLFVSKPTVSRVGPETVNGFDAIKYAVDTTRQTQMDKSALTTFSHLQNYDITGTAWVLKDANCVLQYNIDYQETAKDGKIIKTHYEGTIAKK